MNDDASMMGNVDAVANARGALLEKLMSKRGLKGQPETIKPRSDRSDAPLSYAQERLWFLQQLDPDSPAYNVTFVAEFDREVSQHVMRRVLDEIARRNEILRARYTNVGGKPVQEILPDAHWPFEFVDISGLSETDREGRLKELTDANTRTAFDLAAGPPIRAKLIKRGESAFTVLIGMHHIVIDAFSLDILFSEFNQIFDAFLRGMPSPLPEPVIQYADYASWQRRSLEAGGMAQHLAYWVERIARAESLELPTDRPRSSRPSMKGGTLGFRMRDQASAAVRKLSQNAHATIFMTTLAAFQVLLHRYTGQTDIMVGAPAANRDRPEVQGLIGFFVNTVVMRSQIEGHLTFREALNHVRSVSLEALEHQDLPFEKLVERLAPTRAFGRNPLVDVLFSSQTMAPPKMLNPGEGEANIRGGSPDLAVRFDLEATVIPQANSIYVSFTYNTDLFDAATITRLLSHYQIVLEGIVANPDQRLSDLPLLTDAERRLVLEEWNATARDYGGEGRLHRLLEAQAARVPDAVALEFEGRELTYAELNRRANQLARVLRKRGVGPDVLVGVFAERSFEMVVGLLAVLKVGGAYVPLDPSYPKERLAHMQEDAHAPVVLAQPQLADALPASAAEVLVLDASWAAYAGESSENLEDVGTSEDLAYVIFTSGSTGRPKGAMNEHRGIVNRLLWMQEEYGLTAADRVLQKTPFSFDVSVWEFFWPLMSGARLVIARPEGHRDSAYLVKLIREEGITTLHFVPSMLRVFLEEEGVEACGSLKRVICSGEALAHELQERFFARLPGVELHNLYGPTEAAVDVTYWACQRGDERLSVPIGRPVANTQMYVLDARMQPLPVGVAGELYIGGVQVGRGYVGREDLTAERFVPDPFSKSPGARLYKTGDLGRHLADGAIEYLGRLDYQVKIRGQRIELGEIEAVLDQHPGVGQSVVLAREDSPGDQRLVAYVVARAQAPSAAELKEHLSQALPAYMLPTAYVFLDTLPLTSSGKVDRKALPAPERSTSEAAYVAPRTPTEEILAGIWAEVLKLERVGVEDNFFELGGHSLLATKVVSKARSEFDLKIPLRAMFDERTLAGFADYVATLNWSRQAGKESANVDEIEKIRI